jgi:hypothetical protein
VYLIPKVVHSEISGFTAADCDHLTTDAVRHVVSWHGNEDCARFQGVPIRLRFQLQQAKLYSFEP